MAQKFQYNEKVLCYHGPLLYEAKCVKSRVVENSSGDSENKNELEYFVHYQGWNKNWDEWVKEDRILKINKENMEKKATLMAATQAMMKESKKKSSKSGGTAPSTPTSLSASQHQQELSKEKLSEKLAMSGNQSGRASANTSRASTPVSERSVKTSSGKQRHVADDEKSTSSREDVSESTTGTGRGRNRQRTRTSSTRNQEHQQSEDEQEQSCTPQSEIDSQFSLTIPEELKCVLISDWDLVVHRKKLFTIPAKTSVSQITNDYLKYLERQKSAKMAAKLDSASELMLGIRDLFDALLGPRLLYNIERIQYKEHMEEKPKIKAEVNSSDEDAAGVEVAEKIMPSNVYGSAHLLRLMVKMNRLLDATSIKHKLDMDYLEQGIQDFLTYLDNFRSRYFTSKNYTDASQEYLQQMTLQLDVVPKIESSQSQ